MTCAVPDRDKVKFEVINQDSISQSVLYGKQRKRVFKTFISFTCVETHGKLTAGNYNKKRKQMV